jgi:hypothetical protein
MGIIQIRLRIPKIISDSDAGAEPTDNIREPVKFQKFILSSRIGLAFVRSEKWSQIHCDARQFDSRIPSLQIFISESFSEAGKF